MRETLFDRIARLPDTKPDVLERLARMWEAFGEDGEDDEVAASSLLLGLARLCTQQLATQSVDGHHLVDPVPQPGEVLILTLLNGDNSGRPIEIAASGWDTAARDALHAWMFGEVRRALFSTEPDEEADDESDDEEEFPIRIAVERQAPGGSPQPVGTIKLSWSLRTQRYVEATRKDALMSWKAETSRTCRRLRCCRRCSDRSSMARGKAAVLRKWRRRGRATCGRSGGSLGCVGNGHTRAGRRRGSQLGGGMVWRRCGDFRESRGHGGD